MVSRTGASSGAVGLAVGDDGALGLRRRRSRRGPTRGPQLGRNAILAALRSRSGTRTEGNLFLLPGGIEGGEIVGILVRFEHQGCEDIGLRLDVSQSLRAREHGRV